MSVTGHPNSEPTRVGTSIGDITAGLFTAIGINAALYDREKTGKGMFIDVSMLDCQIAILENAIARYLSKNEIPKPLGSRHPSIAPFEAFKTKDSYIIIAAGNDKLFNNLCEALNLDYDKVVEYSTIDKRLGKSHWSVPGPDGDFGFGGHCFPKDLSAIINITKDLNTTNNVLRSAQKTNYKLRKNRDWEVMLGRAVNYKIKK